jgi:uncharacterized protein YeaO (DUF488 family)
MAIHVIRLGGGRGEAGLRLGTVRRPPRGVRKEDIARDHYDIWLPELAPTTGLLAYAHARAFTDARWKAFEKKYRAEMGKAPASRVIALLAALSPATEFAVGCYCRDEARCHRSILRELLREAGARIAG